MQIETILILHRIVTKTHLMLFMYIELIKTILIVISIYDGF